MRIAEARVVVCSPGRNFVTLKLTTEDGLTGLGDATLNGRELAVKSYLEDHVAPLLVGRDARRIEDTWQYLYKGAYWRRGPVTMTAIAAVESQLAAISVKLLYVDRKEYERNLASLREHLNANTLSKLWAKGKALSFDETIRLALGTD